MPCRGGRRRLPPAGTYVFPYEPKHKTVKGTNVGPKTTSIALVRTHIVAHINKNKRRLKKKKKKWPIYKLWILKESKIGRKYCTARPMLAKRTWQLDLRLRFVKSILTILESPIGALSNGESPAGSHFYIMMVRTCQLAGIGPPTSGTSLAPGRYSGLDTVTDHRGRNVNMPLAPKRDAQDSRLWAAKKKILPQIYTTRAGSHGVQERRAVRSLSHIRRTLPIRRSRQEVCRTVSGPPLPLSWAAKVPGPKVLSWEKFIECRSTEIRDGNPV